MSINFRQTVDFGNQRATNVGSPSGATDVANKQYVDAAIQGLDWKASVRAASTGNINLASPGATIDGVAMAVNDRFLAKDQTAGSENGIYVWNGAAVAATRALDANTNALVTTGMASSVEEGAVNANKMFLLITPEPITLGTTALAFTTLGGTPYTAGNGLALAGNTFSAVAGTGISIGTGIGIDVSVVARKYAANIGDGASTTINVTHGLGTRDVTVQLYTNGTPWDTEWCEVQRPDVNTVTLVFGSAPASGAYRVVVTG